jgi:hypothetical protein
MVPDREWLISYAWLQHFVLMEHDAVGAPQPCSPALD